MVWTLASCQRKPAPPAVPTPSRPPETAGVAVTLYFLQPGEGEGDDMLKGEVRHLPDQRPMTLLQALLEGPHSEALLPLLPAGTKVRLVRREGERLIVDFSKEFQDFTAGSTFAFLAVYSVVNTLTELSGVEEVQIIIEGRPVSDFAGTVDLTQPLKRDMTLVAE